MRDSNPIGVGVTPPLPALNYDIELTFDLEQTQEGCIISTE
jgi:hypothetical protein